MKEMFDQAFKEGVCGISTGLVYYPQCFSTTEELLELMKIAAKHGGIHHTHTREGTEGIKEVIKISEKSGVPVHITHTTPTDEQFSLLETAIARGVDITFDAHPYTAGSSFLSGIYFPGWVHDGGRGEMLERIKEPQVRERIDKEWRERPPERWPNGQRGKPIIAWCQNENYRKYEGKTINEISNSMDLDIIDTFCVLLMKNKGNIMYVGLNNYIHNSIKKAYQHSIFLVGSDAWALAPYGPLHIGYPHPRCYGSYPKILGKFVRQLGLFSYEDAIRKMTWNPAQRMLVKDRGALLEGMAADITIFDPNSVIDNATYRKPHQYPSGIEYVIVNGSVTIEKGEHTGALEGKVLRFQSRYE
jgi:N-acyl-D-aspartate/D-glutamate deacylase